MSGEFHAISEVDFGLGEGFPLRGNCEHACLLLNLIIN